MRYPPIRPKSPRSPRSPRPGFTLIELLVVMGIIGLLVAMLFPAAGAVRQAANRARAQQEVKALETAIKKYYNVYGRYPLQNAVPGAGSGRVYNDSEYTNMVAILRNVVATDNPRGETFLEVQESSMNNTNVLVDPWGNRYRVTADWRGIRVVLPEGYPSDMTLTGQTVAVHSRGPDGLSDTAARRTDDIVSWGK